MAKAISSGTALFATPAAARDVRRILVCQLRQIGDVLLATALNDVANTTLAGSAGGDFEFQDANTLAIGSVSAVGFDATSGQLSSVGATGITAGGDAFVRNLQGDLTLNAGVTATDIDLVTAGRLQNVAGASLVASGDWRVWANTWDGETRGGLAGDGNLPNLYGCAYLGACGVTVPGTDNHFIYVQQPIALITFDNATREYGLANPVFTFSVTGAILGDTAANVASGNATTTATIGSDVGNYAITGNFLSAAGYRIQFVPGTLAAQDEFGDQLTEHRAALVLRRHRQHFQDIAGARTGGHQLFILVDAIHHIHAVLEGQTARLDQRARHLAFGVHYQFDDHDAPPQTLKSLRPFYPSSHGFDRNA